MSSTGNQEPRATADEGGARVGDAPSHGSTGEGSWSAMARLMSQEQARGMPAAPDVEAPAVPD